VVSFVFLVALAQASGAGLDMTSRYGLWRGLAHFGIDLALGALFLACQNNEVGGRPLPASAHTLAQIGVLATVAAGFCLGGPARTPLDLVIAVPIFALIFLLAFDKGLIARALHTPGLMKLGEWSFAIYMVHYIAMYFLPSFGLPDRPWQAFIGGLAASIAAGALAWRFVERPLGDAMRRRLLSAWG
jgi:peptidoglycan/LPS O-acetylase OafA/YrhL